MHAGTQNSINWLRLYALAKEFVNGRSSKARTASQITIGKIRYTKKIDNIFVIIIIAFNHRQGKIKYPLTLILHIQSEVWQSGSNILSSCNVLSMCP